MTHLILAAVLLFFALWAVVEPPHGLFWVLSVPAKEWGWAGALLALPLLWPGWIHGPLAFVGAALALVALILFLVPLVAAIPAAHSLPRDLEAAFGPVPPAPGDRPAPFVWRDLFLGVRAPKVPVTTYTFAVHDGKELKLDLTRPAGGGPAPCLVVIHGGAWRSGDRTQLPALNRYLTARGYATAAISYRLSPAYRFRDALQDVLAAVDFLKRQARDLGIDPQRLVLLGRSAGAQLAVVAAYTADDPAIRGAVAYYGPFDLEWGWYQKCKVLDSRTVLRNFLGGDPSEVPETYRAASPLHLIGPSSPPVLLLQGAADTMVSPLHSRHLIERLKAAGRPYYMLLVPQATHGSDVNFSGPFGQMTTYAVERFLRVCFRKELPVPTEK